ncbi:TBC1 domain family member 2B-like, partial [Brachionus plicatilis]
PPFNDSIKQFTLFGGEKHKNRLKEYLEECRRNDPSFPSWESVTSNECFVDKYGFRYNKSNEYALIHYICQQISIFYKSQPKLKEANLWETRLREWKKSLDPSSEVKSMIRSGILPKYRSEFWKLCIYRQVGDIKKSKGPNYYQFLCNLSNDLPRDIIKFDHQIFLDLFRTLPNNVKFCSKYSQGINQLQEVLRAFCLYNPNIGYCQGMNFIVGIALLFLDPEDAFWCLVAITEKFFLAHYFDCGLVGAQSDQHCLKQLIELKLPDLHYHLKKLDIDISTITLNWFMALFFDALPFETMLRIWDCFLLE